MLRYVESNPLRARMVERAEQWAWSSLGGRAGADGVSVRLETWPVPRPSNWPALVNRPLPADKLDRLRTSVRRGRPFGDDKWVAATAARLGLQSTLRDPWRPAKKDKAVPRAKSPAPAKRK